MAGNLTITAPVVTPPPVVVTPPASAPAPAAPAPTPVVTPVITPAPVVAPAPAPAPVVTPVIAPIIEAAPTPTKAAFFIPPTVEQKSQQSMDNGNEKNIIAANPNKPKSTTTLEVMIREDLAKEFDVKPDKFWLKIIPNLK